MSDVLNLKTKLKQQNVALYNPLETNNLKSEKDENYFNRELEREYKRGFDEGEKLTKQRLENEYAEKLNKKYELVNQAKILFEELIPAYEQSFEKAVIDLSVVIAEKIVHREIQVDSIISNALNGALKKVVGANRVIVKLNPADLEKVNSIKEDALSNGSFDKIKFEQDNRIEPGGCFVETELGSVDARISSQFNEILRQLESKV